MKHNLKPTMEELSLYYDGLLDAEDRRRVEAWLESDPLAKDTLAVFQRFDQALQPSISDLQIDELLDDTLQNVHARIYDEDRLKKYQSTSVWSWFSPRAFATVFTCFVALFVVVFALNNPQDTITQTGGDGGHQPITQLPQNESPELSVDAVQDTLKKESVLAAARFAKTVYQSGVEYASSRQDNVKQSFQEIKKDAEHLLTLSTLPSLTDLAADENPENAVQEQQTPPPAAATLAQVGKQQIAIGLSVSALSYMVGM